MKNCWSVGSIGMGSLSPLHNAATDGHSCFDWIGLPMNSCHRDGDRFLNRLHWNFRNVGIKNILLIVKNLVVIFNDPWQRQNWNR